MRTTNEIREKIVKMYLEGYSIVKIMAEVGVRSTNTIFRVLDAAGVKGAERQEREADVINVTITDAAVVQWLRSQPNAAEAIAKLVYSQIEGSQKQNSRIADSTVLSTDDPTEITVDFYTKKKEYLGTETIFSTYKLAFDILKQYKDSKYHVASYAETKDGETIFSFEM